MVRMQQFQAIILSYKEQNQQKQKIYDDCVVPCVGFAE